MATTYAHGVGIHLTDANAKINPHVGDNSFVGSISGESVNHDRLPNRPQLYDKHVNLYTRLS
ncbi:hypothetical protein HanPI659440_Chr00c21g0734771 [Helianthus annuus]|nr:hypothetical protein HanPI659440_Chr00c21g0734771 [Helianthus annuus]